MHTTSVARRIAAPRARVFRALVDAEAVAAWRAPHGMTATVHEFDAVPGGRFRVSLTYADPSRAGKSDGHTDTYAGHFVEIVADERVVEQLQFETGDPGLRGVMTMTTTLTDDGDATLVELTHEGLPDAVAPADNELGTRIALDNLARLVESG